MTDISKIFKTTIKAIRLNSNIKPDLNEELNLKKSEQSRKKHSTISHDALDVVRNISKLRDFLVDNKQNYIQPNYLVSDETVLSDEVRQTIDSQAESVIHSCLESVNLLKSRAFAQSLTEQQKTHFENLFMVIDRYLKDVCKIHSVQRAVQVQRTIEKKNFSQLYTPSISSLNKNKDQSHLNETKPDDDVQFDNALSVEELQAFEQENNTLYDHLTSMSHEIKQIESQVIEISRLQQVFTEKIFEQDHSIDYVQRLAVKTTDNIKLGNEEIQEAMKKNSALRLWILFVVIVLSFTLLFLDWYND